MKKLLSLTLAVMLSGAAAYGKSHEKDNAPKFGIKLKPHFARVGTELYIELKNSTDSTSTDSLPFYLETKSVFRPSLGLFGEYGLNDIVGLQIALEYAGQGGGGYEKSGPGAILKLDYLMLSAVPRFYPVENSTLCIFVGLRVSWLAAAKWQKYLDGKKDGKEVDLLKEDTKEEEEKLKRIDLGMPFGLDYEFDNGLLLGFDANMGLTKIFKDAEKSFSKTYVSSYGLTVGYNLAKLL